MSRSLEALAKLGRKLGSRLVVVGVGLSLPVGGKRTLSFGTTSSLNVCLHDSLSATFGDASTNDTSFARAASKFGGCG